MFNKFIINRLPIHDLKKYEEKFKLSYKTKILTILLEKIEKKSKNKKYWFDNLKLFK